MIAAQLLALLFTVAHGADLWMDPSPAPSDATGGLLGVPERIDTEIALITNGVDSRSASVLKVSLSARPRGSGLSARSLEDGSFLPAPRSGRCAAFEADALDHHAPVVPFADEGGGTRMGNSHFILVHDDPRMSALVPLMPGETLVFREERRYGRVVRTTTTLSRADSTVVFEQTKNWQARVCVRPPRALPRSE